MTWLGGSDETAHITLETEGQQVSCIFTTRAIAKALGSKLYDPVRLHGQGKWTRQRWKLVSDRFPRLKVMSRWMMHLYPPSSISCVKFQWNGATMPIVELKKIETERRKGKRNGGH